MADIKKSTDGPTPFSREAYDFTLLPDYDNDFIGDEDISEFAKALAAPEISPSQDDLASPPSTQQNSVFITALNDWRPVHQRVRGRAKRKRPPPRRGKDETREGFVYTVLKWPLLVFVFGWIGVLGISYFFTRWYIYLYEHWITWRGNRETLRRRLNSSSTYEDWVNAAKELDAYLGNDKWKKVDEYAYYDSKTIRRVKEQMSRCRERAQSVEDGGAGDNNGVRAIDELRGLAEACVKNNFVGFENPRLYSETYYGTKDLVQGFVDEAQASLDLLLRTKQLSQEDKRSLFKHIHTNFGRTALCLSGGATFAYYHFGVAKALLDAGLMPEVITGTSGGALVAALLGTRTDEELKKLLVPALANRITACHEGFATWVRRWWRTGARFDSVDWARRCSWFCRGSMTFREAYQRTGRILNVSCVPSDPHSPTILANYLTSPDCVIWSAVLASAAVPGILNPVVLMKKNPDGTLAPYSFGHKWKDGSLRTDIPLKALNLHFNVNFSIVSQVNPHINLFFFSSRGSVGRPVTHRRGRGWRGGFLGSATEQYLKLDLTKWLKVLRHLELLPRPLGQDWSEIWLQRFSGTITIWPKSIPSDFYHILSDPTPARLARMIHVGQQSAFPKLTFIANRMKLERIIEQGRKDTRPKLSSSGSLENVLSAQDIRSLLREAKKHNGVVAPPPLSIPERDKPRLSPSPSQSRASSRPPSYHRTSTTTRSREESPSISKRLTGWWSGFNASPRASLDGTGRPSATDLANLNGEQAERRGSPVYPVNYRRNSVMSELGRQTRVFFDDLDAGESSFDEEGEQEVGDAETEARMEGEGGGNEGQGEGEEDAVYDDDDEEEEEEEEEDEAEAEEWDVEEDKDKVGMAGEREREEDAIQGFGDGEKEGGGTVVG